MSKSLKLKHDDLLGNSTVFLIIPFSTGEKTFVDYKKSDFKEWYTYGANENSDAHMRLEQPESNSLLRQLLDKDKEIYHEGQIKKNPFTRGLIKGASYTKKKLRSIDLKILVTYHSDGIGTAVMINSLPSMTMQNYFEVIKELQAWQTQIVEKTKQYTVQDYLEGLFSTEKNRKKLAAQIKWGEEYPFFAIGGSDIDISSVPQFVEENKPLVYALSHQDYNYNGWKRIREDSLDALLDRDLSRRNEYGLYLTDTAMVEIDANSRQSFIATWANRRNTTNENMRIKLLFERVQLLELLLTQRFILQDIDSNIQEYDLTSKTPIKQLVRLKNKITSALSDYYYANAMTRQHVSGTEWVAYGQHRFHLDELLEHIKSRVELIESVQQMKTDFNNMRGNYVFQLISILLGSSAVVGTVDVLAEFPFLSGTWFADNTLWIKGGIYMLFLALIAVLTIRYTKDR